VTTLRQLIESRPAYQRDSEWLKLSNKALRVMPSSPRQKEILKKMRAIEAKYAIYVTAS